MKAILPTTYTARVSTQYYKTANVNGKLQLQILEYATAKVTPMHERIRHHYPARTSIGNIVAPRGCWSMFCIDTRIESDDWKWAHEQAVKQYRAKRLQAAKI